MSFYILFGLFVLTLFAAGYAFFVLYKRMKNGIHKLHHDIQNLRFELAVKTTALDALAYAQVQGEESIVYDGRGRNVTDDFSGRPFRAWDYVANGFTGAEAKGRHSIEGDTITVERGNTDGRYELYLKTYGYNSRNDVIPADDTVGTRRLRLCGEVKKGTTPHTLRFVFKGASQNVLDEKEYVVFNEQWEKFVLFFNVSAHEASFLRIDDLNVHQPSSIQIRNLVLYEKK